MLKLIMCVRRLPHLTREQFDTHWWEIHGPLVERHQKILGIKRYIQNVPLDNPAAQNGIQAGRGTLPSDFDGCAELWWNSMEEHLAARNSAEGMQALHELMEDEKKFVDLSQSILWYAEERTVIADDSLTPETRTD